MKYRSKIESMHLALLTKSCSVTKNGLDVILDPLINDLKLWQKTGVVATVNGMTYTLLGHVAFVRADNLAANQIAGFTQNFSHG